MCMGEGELEHAKLWHQEHTRQAQPWTPVLRRHIHRGSLGVQGQSALSKVVGTAGEHLMALTDDDCVTVGLAHLHHALACWGGVGWGGTAQAQGGSGTPRAHTHREGPAGTMHGHESPPPHTQPPTPPPRIHQLPTTVHAPARPLDSVTGLDTRWPGPTVKPSCPALPCPHTSSWPLPVTAISCSLPFCVPRHTTSCRPATWGEGGASMERPWERSAGIKSGTWRDVRADSRGPATSPVRYHACFSCCDGLVYLLGYTGSV